MKEKALHDENAGENDDRGAWAKQDRCQDSANQMAAGSTGHRKVQHLRRKDECTAKSHEGNALWRQIFLRLPKRHAQSAGGQHHGGASSFAIEKPIGNVHCISSRSVSREIVDRSMWQQRKDERNRDRTARCCVKAHGEHHFDPNPAPPKSASRLFPNHARRLRSRHASRFFARRST